MYMHATYAHAPQKRTSLQAPLPAAETLVAAATVAAASPGPRTVEPRLPVAKAATIERPVRVEESTRQHAIVGRLGERGAEFEAWLQPRTSRRREEVVVHGEPHPSNPAATSNSWWQGPPLGLSQTPRRSRHPAHMSHSHGSPVVWAKVQAPIVRRSTNRLRAYSGRSSMTHRRQTVHLRHCGAQWPNGSSLMARPRRSQKRKPPPHAAAGTISVIPSWPSYRL